MKVRNRIKINQSDRFKDVNANRYFTIVNIWYRFFEPSTFEFVQDEKEEITRIAAADFYPLFESKKLEIL